VESARSNGVMVIARLESNVNRMDWKELEERGEAGCRKWTLTVDNIVGLQMSFQPGWASKVCKKNIL